METELSAPVRARRWRLWVAGLSAAVVVGGIGAYLLVDRPSELERTDPAGAAACQNLRDWINGDLKDHDSGQPVDKLIAGMTVAVSAKDSVTPAIRAASGANLMDDPQTAILKTYGGPGEFRVADLVKVHAACVAAGERMPAYTEPR